MAATRIFITGASGFIGGDFLHILDAAKLPVCITILERSESDAKTIQSKFPDVRIVRGTLDDASLLEQESAAADIVVNLASAQHFPSVQAIHRGLSQQQRASPPYLLQISGATLLSASEVAQKRFGQASDVVVNDWDDIARVRAIIRASPNRRIDNFVLDVADREPKVLTALLGGPIIYGQGRGLVNQRSGQLPELARIALQRGKAMYIGEGRNRWSGVHIHDFSDLLLRLTKKTIERDQDTNIWGANGVYLPGTHEAPTFAELAREIQRLLKSQGWSSETDVDSVTVEEANKLSPNAQLTLGTNGRGLSGRAQRVLDWRSSPSRVIDDLPRTIEVEAARSKIARL